MQPPAQKSDASPPLVRVNPVEMRVAAGRYVRLGKRCVLTAVICAAAGAVLTPWPHDADSATRPSAMAYRWDGPVTFGRVRQAAAQTFGQWRHRAATMLAHMSATLGGEVKLAFESDAAAEVGRLQQQFNASGPLAALDAQWQETQGLMRRAEEARDQLPGLVARVAQATR